MNIKARIIALSMAAAMVLSMGGCSNKTVEANATEGSSESSAVTETTAVTPAVLEITIPVGNGSSGESQPEETTAPAATDSQETTEAETTAAVQQNTDINLDKVIALTFDDGPDTKESHPTKRILDVLDKYGIKATFFLQGEAVEHWMPERNHPTLKRMAESGHEIATHTYSHPDLNTLTTEAIQEEVKKSCDVIEKVTGVRPTLIRPPYGNANDTVKAAIDMPMILWDVDTMDWDHKDPEQTIQRILDGAEGGSIILMHDIWSATADAMEQGLERLIEEGYTMVTVSELFELYGKELEGHNTYMSAR